jgi:hypothetical protein
MSETPETPAAGYAEMVVVPKALVDSLTASLDATRASADNYRNALEHIRVDASIHYLGGAFEPAHMRAIANFATEALSGKDIPRHPVYEEPEVPEPVAFQALIDEVHEEQQAVEHG